MEFKIIVPPGTPPTLIGICKKLLEKKKKIYTTYQGFTGLTLPDKKMAIIFLPQFASRIFINQTFGDIEFVDFEATFVVYTGEPTRHEVSYTPLPENKGDSSRLFGSSENGEPYLKNSGWNNFTSGLNTPAWVEYFNQLASILADIPPNASEYDAQVAEGQVHAAITAYMTQFDAYNYVLTHFPENSIPDALLDFVGKQMAVFPTYNGIPIYQGPAQPVANGNPMWIEMYPHMCRKTATGEYIIIFLLDVLQQHFFGASDYEAPTLTASDLHITDEELARGSINSFSYRISSVTKLYWVAYKARDVLSKNYMRQQFFSLLYSGAQYDPFNFNPGWAHTVSFSFDSTVDGQDFQIRFALPSAARLQLVQNDNIIIDAQVLASHGVFQKYDEFTVYDNTPATGTYFPYESLPQHSDYLSQSVLVQVSEATVTNVNIPGGYRIAGTLVFTEYLYPNSMRQDFADEWVNQRGNHSYEIAAEQLYYWEPYKFYDIGQHIGVGSKKIGIIAPDQISFGTTPSSNAFGAQGVFSGFNDTDVEDFPYGNADNVRVTTTRELSWWHASIWHQYRNREINFYTGVVIERETTVNTQDTFNQTAGEVADPQNYTISRTENTFNSTQTKNMYDRVYKTFDIIGDDLVITDGEPVNIPITFDSFSGRTYNHNFPGVPDTGYLNQANLNVGAVSYDIDYQEYPGAPKQLGARINIPASYIRPRKGINWNPSQSGESHTTDSPWQFKVDPLQITPGIFTQLSSGETQGTGLGHTSNARNLLFRNIAGNILQTKDGDFYLNGNFLFRPAETLIDDAGWEFAYAGYAGEFQTFGSNSIDYGDFADIVSPDLGSLPLLWGDANTVATYNTYSLTTSYKSAGIDYSEIIRETDGSGISVTEHIPKIAMIYMGNNIHTGQPLAFMRYNRTYGGDYPGNAAVVGQAVTRLTFYDPWQFTNSFTTYTTTGRSEKLTFDEKLSAVGHVTNHGWFPFQAPITIQYVRTNGASLDSNSEYPQRFQVDIVAFLDDNQQLKLCFYRRGYEPLTSTGFDSGNNVKPAWLYNDFMTPDAVAMDVDQVVDITYSLDAVGDDQTGYVGSKTFWRYLSKFMMNTQSKAA